MNDRPSSTAILTGILRFIWQNPSNDGARLRHLAQTIAWQAYKRTVALPIVITLDNGLRYLAHPRAGNSAGAIYCRIYEAEYVLFARRHIVRREHGAILDVGAHTGLFTLLLAECFEAGACFEPAPDTFEILDDNLRLNRLAGFEPVRAAVSSSSGTVHFEMLGEFSGVNRISSGAESGAEVRSTSLDDYCRARGILGNVTFLKIDTEGHELEVLDGAKEIIRANPDLLVLAENCDYQKLDSLFREHGMTTFSVSRDGEIIRPAPLSYNIFACGPAHPFYRELR